MKVIFLDIDGVLNSQDFVNELGKLWNGSQLDKKAIDRLNQITESTGAKIVISSTWRILYSFDELTNLLKKEGVKAEVIDVTPCLNDSRQTEILCWLEANRFKFNIKNFIVLDDNRIEGFREELNSEFKTKFVKTIFKNGLLDKHVAYAISVLNS